MQSAHSHARSRRHAPLRRDPTARSSRTPSDRRAPQLALSEVQAAQRATASRLAEAQVAYSAAVDEQRQIQRLVPRGLASPQDAIEANTAVDRAGTTFALFGICMPNFLLALLLIFVFWVTLRWLPISGYMDPLEEGWDGFRSLVFRSMTAFCTNSK